MPLNTDVLSSFTGFTGGGGGATECMRKFAKKFVRVAVEVGVGAPSLRDDASACSWRCESS
jgi:hypothetical protein